MDNLFIPLAALIVAFLAWKGFLTERRLARGPQRRVEISEIDLALGLAMPCFLPLVLSALTRSDAAATQSAPLSVEVAVSSLVSQIFVQAPALGLLLFRAAYAPDGWCEIGLVPRRHWRDLLRGLAALLLVVPVVLGMLRVTMLVGRALGSKTPDIGHSMLVLMRDSPSPAATALLVIGAVLVAPILEEITFRGLLQTGLRQRWPILPRWGVVILASAIFAVVHAPAVAWEALPALFVLGLGMGWLYEASGSLLPPVLLHAGFNALNVALLFLRPDAP
jgi:membrane protease YdiL (CAAX protease family)